jgi:DNA-binding protein H-NS
VSSAAKLSERSRQLLERYLQLKAQLEEEKKRELQTLQALRDLALQLLRQIDEEIQRRRLEQQAAPPRPAPSLRPAALAQPQQPPSGSAAGGGSRRGFEALA